MYDYTCQQCGKHFTHRYPHSSPYAPRFCTPECGSASRRKHQPRLCVLCGKEYKPYYRGQKFCGQDCKFEAHRRKGVINCEQCGKPFKRGKRAIRYCSSQCYGLSMLSAFPRKGKEFSKATRRAIKQRDNHACVTCGSTCRLEVDHIVPVALGGDNSISNGQTLCHTCHRAKSHRQRKQVLRGH